jgi:hypothetical protein
MKNLVLIRDEYEVSIFIEQNENIENDDLSNPLYIVSWTEDEWLENPELTLPAITSAIELYYTNQKLLLENLGFGHLYVEDDKQELVDKVIEQIKVDCDNLDFTAIDELLKFVDVEYLNGYLAED